MEVQDVNDPPVLVSPSHVFVLEQTVYSPLNASLTRVVLHDDDVNDTHVFALAPTPGNVRTATNETAFLIDAATGELLPASVVNFEEQAEFQVVVDVVDTSSVEPLVVNVSFVINVTLVDVNDPPLLASPSTIPYPENWPVGDAYTYVVASEEDVNDTVTYTIVGGNDNPLPAAGGAPAFALNASSGALSPASVVSFETTPTFVLLVRLSDDGTARGGTPPLTTTWEVVVEVQDVNEPPVFTTTPTDTAFVRERTADLGSVFHVVPLPDDPEDPAAVNITFSIAAGNDDGFFELSPPGSRNLAASTFAVLDFENASFASFNLTVQATDPAGLVGLLPLRVVVVDVNDPPVWTSPGVVYVEEEPPDDRLLYASTIFDPDAGDSWTYEITGASHPNNGASFRIEATTGRVYRGGRLSVEHGPAAYDLYLLVTDAAGAAVPYTVRVIVTDINEAPRLSDALLADNSTLFVLENVHHRPLQAAPSRHLSDPIGPIGVYEEDAGQTTEFVFAPGGNPVNTAGFSVFLLDRFTGVLTMNPDLDEFDHNLNHEAPAVSGDPNPWPVTVILMDDGSPPLNTTVTVYVFAVDGNDYPVFWGVDFFSAPETAVPLHQVLYNLEVEDEDHIDALGHGDWATYEIIAGDDDGEFVLDSDRGWLFFARDANFESNGNKAWDLVIRAVDRVARPDVLAIEFPLPGELINFNDAPHFTSPDRVQLPENWPVGRRHPFYTLQAFDDEGHDFKYRIVAGNTIADGFDAFFPSVLPPSAAPFVLNADSGAVHIDPTLLPFPFSPVDYDRGPTRFEVTFEARDDGEFRPSNASRLYTVTVQVQEVNEPVVFDPLYVTLDLAYNARVGYVLYRSVPPFEPDPPNVLNVTYSIVDGNPDGTFAIGFQDKAVYELWVDQPAPLAGGAAFSQPLYNLTVQGTDGGVPPQSAIMFITVHITPTAVQLPNAATTCYMTSVCQVRFRPSYRHEAQSFLLGVYAGDDEAPVADAGPPGAGPQPNTTLIDPYLGLLPALDRASDGVVEHSGTDGAELSYMWTVPALLPRAVRATVRVRSPAAGTDYSAGVSSKFTLEFPVLYVAGAWLDGCAFDDTVAGCGRGWMTRPVYCVDVRPAGVRPDYTDDPEVHVLHNVPIM